MNVTETIRTFHEFFGDRGHQVVPGSSLVPPEGDPVLFTTAGMHPLTRYLEEGRPHPRGRRLTGVQRCLRTTDLDEVGDDRHLTVFQMLGSWSLGDYDGPQSLRWGVELLTERLGISRDRLHATVFGGDEHVGPDLPSWQTWTDLGVPVERLGPDNWWSNGPTGPCGPDSELFAWTGDGPPRGTPGTDGRWVELWNHVTMSYRRQDDGSLEPLPQRNVDTGMGLERPDSTRTLDDLPTSLIEQTLAQFGQQEDGDRVREMLRSEERRFASLLTRGRKVLAQLRPGRPLTEADLRYLHQTHGLPPELVTELLG